MKKDNVLLLHDIGWFIGYENNTKKVSVIPFIYNNQKTKIKDLTNNIVYDISEFCTAHTIMSKQYNLKAWAVEYLFNLKDLDRKPRHASHANFQDEYIDSKQMLHIKSVMEKTYQKYVNKYYKLHAQKNAIKAFENTSKDF